MVQHVSSFFFFLRLVESISVSLPYSTVEYEFEDSEWVPREEPVGVCSAVAAAAGWRLRKDEMRAVDAGDEEKASDIFAELFAEIVVHTRTVHCVQWIFVF